MSVPKLRFKEFDKSWCSSPLKELCKINQGLQIAIEERFLNEGKNRYFYITNEFLKEGSKKSYYIENPPKSVICTDSDILMTRTGNTGQVVTGVSGAFHNNFFKIDFDRKIIDRNFFVEFLKKDTTQHWILKYAGASTIPDLNHSDFYRIVMPIPTIEEQTKIASFLSAVDEKINQLTQKHELLSQYKQGMMQKLFSQQIRFKADDGSEFGEWVKVILKDILISYRLGGNYSNSEIKTSYPLIKMGNLSRGSINLDKIEYIPNDEKIDKEDLIKTNDLFFNTRNTLDLVGKVAIWKDELPQAYYNSNLMRIEFENNIFMNYLFNEKSTLEKLKSIASGTTSVAAIYTKDLLKINLEIPCLEEQTKIANFLSSIDQKIEVVAQQIEQAKQWKKGLLQQMFV